MGRISDHDVSLKIAVVLQEPLNSFPETFVFLQIEIRGVVGAGAECGRDRETLTQQAPHPSSSPQLRYMNYKPS
jgi:hypothetical protein